MTEPQASEAVEAACRAICEVRGTSPDALYQHNFEGDFPEDERREYADPFTGEPRTQLFHRAWRTHDKIAIAAIAAVEATLRPMIEAEVANWLREKELRGELGYSWALSAADAIENGDHRTKGRDDGE